MIGRGLSLRLRLTLWHLLVLAVILGIFSIGTYEFVRMGLSAQLDEQLEETSSQIAARARTGPSEEEEDFSDLDDLEKFDPSLMFEIRREGRPVYTTAGWKREETCNGRCPTPSIRAPPSCTRNASAADWGT